MKSLFKKDMVMKSKKEQEQVQADNNENGQSKKGGEPERTAKTEKTEKTAPPETRYDRRTQRRREQEEADHRSNVIWTCVGIVLLVAIVAAVAFFWVIRPLYRSHATYITVGEHRITYPEFEFYRSASTESYIDTYSAYFQYFGFDPDGDYTTQMYSEDLSWQDYFDEMAAGSIQEQYGLVDDARKQGFTHDTEAECDETMENMKSLASDAGMPLGDYIHSRIGTTLNTRTMRRYLADSFYATAYLEKLRSDLAASDAEIQAYYDEHPDDYDSVSFITQTYAADIPEEEETDDAEELTEDEQAARDAEREAVVAEAMASAQALAEAGLEGLADSADAETHVDARKPSVSSYYSDWLFDAERKEGDTTVVENTAANSYIAVQFTGRTLIDGDTDEDGHNTWQAEIATTLLNESMEDYLKNLCDQTPVGDPHKHLAYMQLPEASEVEASDVIGVE